MAGQALQFNLLRAGHGNTKTTRKKMDRMNGVAILPLSLARLESDQASTMPFRIA
jgi:hypothetical protein